MIAIACPSIPSTKPNRMLDTPISKRAKPRRFGCPKESIIQDTCGEKIIKAMEKVANTIPTYSLRMCFPSKTGGRKGAESA